MNKQIDITVAIPVYNADLYVADTIRSVLEQDFTGTYEIIIIDDHGTDRSMEVVAELQRTHPRGGLIRVIRPEHNIGQGKGRVMALQAAKGQYFFMMDDDDLLLPHTLSHLYDLQQKHAADLVWGSTAYGTDASHRYAFDDVVLKNNQSVQEYWFSHYCYMVWNILYKTEFLKTCQFTINDGSMHGIEDAYVMLQVVQKATKVVFSSRITYLYRRYQNSSGGQVVHKKNVDFRIWDTWIHYIEDYMRPMAWPTECENKVVCRAEKFKRTAWQSIMFIGYMFRSNGWRISKEMKPYIKRLKVYPIPGHVFLVMKRIFNLPSYRLGAVKLYVLYHFPLCALKFYLRMWYKKQARVSASYNGSRPDWAQTMLACYNK